MKILEVTVIFTVCFAASQIESGREEEEEGVRLITVGLSITVFRFSIIPPSIYNRGMCVFFFY